jgi:chromosome partitioning protein
MFDKRNRLSHQVAGDITKHFETRVFEIIIPRNVRLAESPSHGLPVYFYDKQSFGSKAYVELARQFLIRQGE